MLSLLQGFEELLASTNVLNRKLEEVLGMTREYETIAALWNSFHELMRNQRVDVLEEHRASSPGLPGTGGHTLTGKTGT
jgi:DASH complex subunit DAD1